VQHASELEQPSRLHSDWARSSLGNGGADGKDKEEFKCFPRWEEKIIDKVITHREFKVGDHVLLKVKSRRSSLKLGNCSKLAASYCGPFEVLDRIGLVAYMLALTSSLCIHNSFHVSFIKK
jgi:hypothetical protein